MAKEMNKAVILARGLGTRMRKADGEAQMTAEQEAVAATGVKAMIPIDRPFLDYVMHDLAEAGFTRVCLVIGPEHQQVRDYYGQKLQPKRLKIEFAIQEKALGTGDAVKSAAAFAGDDHVLVINSDNYYPADCLRRLRQLDGPGLAGFEREALLAGSNIPADRISKFSVIQADARDFMTRIIEKPDPATLAAMPEPVLVSMNCWRFSPNIFTACRAIKPSPRGEYEITDAVQYTIDQMGEKYNVLSVQAAVLDLSSRGDIAAVTDILKGRPVHL